MPSFHTKKADFWCQKVFESPKHTYFLLKTVLLTSWGAIGVPKYIMGKFMKCFNFLFWDFWNFWVRVLVCTRGLKRHSGKFYEILPFFCWNLWNFWVPLDILAEMKFFHAKWHFEHVETKILIKITSSVWRAPGFLKCFLVGLTKLFL